MAICSEIRSGQSQQHRMLTAQVEGYPIASVQLISGVHKPDPLVPIVLPCIHS